MDNEELENDVNEAAEGLDNQNEEVTKEVGKFESVLETKGKQAVATASKKVIAKLLKKKIIIISLVGAVILLFFIIMAALLNSSGVNDYVYKSTSCKNVTIHYDPYGEGDSYDEEMDLEDYVKGAVVAYLNNFTGDDSSNYQLYFALSVALRNEAITNNCEVTYRDKTIDSNVTIDDYYLNLAITNSYGIALVDENEEFVPMHVADNCWYNSGIMQNSEGEDIEFHTAFQKDLEIPREFTKKYFKNTVYEECQCNADTGENEIDINAKESICYTYWIKEEEKDGVKTKVKYEEYLHQDEEDGFNLYGAYYLLRYRGLTNLDILKYFTNDKVMYRTTSKENIKKDDSSNSSLTSDCSGFSLTGTTLSREEFIAKVNSFSGNKNDFAVLRDNAGLIYDLSIENNFNPELVYTRAEVEGYSPGGSSYNYYGIGCTNTNPNCTRYSSVSEGVLGFIKLMKSYNVSSLFDVYNVRHYAYIGSYWYEGGSGSGGCYYINSIAKYYVNKERYNLVKNACDTNTGATLPTNDEDQEAYSYFQIEKMTNFRKSIFDIDATNCDDGSYGEYTYGSGKCPTWGQGDTRWGNISLGNSGSNMSSIGCLITSLSMAIACSNTEIAGGDNFNPGVLATYFNNNSGFNSNGAFKWISMTKIAPSFKEVNPRIFLDENNAAAIIKENLDNGYAVVAFSSKISSSGEHWVYVKKINGSKVTVNDPAGKGAQKQYDASVFSRIAVYSYK